MVKTYPRLFTNTGIIGKFHGQKYSQYGLSKIAVNATRSKHL